MNLWKSFNALDVFLFNFIFIFLSFSHLASTIFSNEWEIYFILFFDPALARCIRWVLNWMLHDKAYQERERAQINYIVRSNLRGEKISWKTEQNMSFPSWRNINSIGMIYLMHQAAHKFIFTHKWACIIVCNGQMAGAYAHTHNWWENKIPVELYKQKYMCSNHNV